MIDSVGEKPNGSLPEEKTRVLIVGSTGQVGSELQRTAPEYMHVISADSEVLDITDQENVHKFVTKYSPEIIINAAAYTAVDTAEREEELAYAVNALGAGFLAEAAHAQGSKLIHISTDFVFDGKKSRPYLPNDEPNPLSVYGASKLAGEQKVTEISQGRAVIVRTSWVYSDRGHNFVKTMLKLMRERRELYVVDDQIGTPTWAFNLANNIWELVRGKECIGVFHCTDAGVASWYDFAIAIQQKGIRAGLLKHSIPIHPIPSSEFLTPARRPSFSVLDKTSTWKTLNIIPQHWCIALASFCEQIKKQAN